MQLKRVVLSLSLGVLSCVGGVVTPSRSLATQVYFTVDETHEPVMGEAAIADNPTAIDQVTSVHQLSDVQPTDWAYQALTSLVERYGCIAGYPDGTFWGDRSITRFEFAAALNACLGSQTEVLDSDTVTQEDLESLQRLMQDFQEELQAQRGRVDTLETQVTELEDNQFSTTTRLNILTSFNVSQVFAGGDILAEGVPIPDVSPAARLPLRVVNPQTQTADPVVGTVDADPGLTFSHSTYIVLTTSFSGRDQLTTIIAAGNGDPPASVFSSAGFTSSFGIPYADSNPVTPLDANDIGLFELKYSFPILPTLQAVVGPRILPFRHFDINPYTDVLYGASGLNFYQSTLAGNGLSGTGGLLEWAISPQLLLRAGYLNRNDASQRIFGSSDGAADPARGFFRGNNNILAELTYSPSPDANFRFYYNRAYLEASPLSPPAPFLLQSLRGAVDDSLGGAIEDVISHNFVFNFDWTITPEFALFGRYSYSTSAINPVDAAVDDGNVNIQAFQLGTAFPDLGTAGAIATLSAVIPFDVLAGRRFLVGGYGDGGTQIDLLATYSYPLTDQLALIPMFFVTLNPNNFSENPTVYSIILRTQFLF